MFTSGSTSIGSWYNPQCACGFPNLFQDFGLRFYLEFLQNNIWLDEGAGHFLQNISKKLELCLHNSYCKFNEKNAAVTTAMPIKLICWSVIVSWNNINSKTKNYLCVSLRWPSGSWLILKISSILWCSHSLNNIYSQNK